MAAPNPVPNSTPAPPPADAASIRACLTPQAASEFDAEWELVLDRAKRSHDLTEVFGLLRKWQHYAHTEQVAPGTYTRVLAKAEQILRTGKNPDAVPLDVMQETLRRRLGR